MDHILCLHLSINGLWVVSVFCECCYVRTHHFFMNSISACVYTQMQNHRISWQFLFFCFFSFLFFFEISFYRFTIAFHGDCFPLSPIVHRGSSISKFFQICAIFLFSFVSFLLAIHTKVS